MAKSAIITLTAAGTGTGPFNLLSDVDSFVIPFETGIPKASLVAGYTTNLIPDAASIIRVQSSSSFCSNYIDLTYPGSTTTSTTTTTTTEVPTTTTSTTTTTTTEEPTTTTTSTTTTTTTEEPTTTTTSTTTTTTTEEPTTTTTSTTTSTTTEEPTTTTTSTTTTTTTEEPTTTSTTTTTTTEEPTTTTTSTTTTTTTEEPTTTTTSTTTTTTTEEPTTTTTSTTTTTTTEEPPPTTTTTSTTTTTTTACLYNVDLGFAIGGGNIEITPNLSISNGTPAYSFTVSYEWCTDPNPGYAEGYVSWSINSGETGFIAGAPINLSIVGTGTYSQAWGSIDWGVTTTGTVGTDVFIKGNTINLTTSDPDCQYFYSWLNTTDCVTGTPTGSFIPKG